ncbi:hypothetical protein EGW08_012203, partial [Elysia chlorotica]
MKGPFYEVAAVTPYTECLARNENESNLGKPRRTAPPISALFRPTETADVNSSCRSSADHVSSEGGSSSTHTVVNARYHGPDSSFPDLSRNLSLSEGAYSSTCDHTARQNAPHVDTACEVCTESNTDPNTDHDLDVNTKPTPTPKTNECPSDGIDELERLRNEALQQSLSLWKDKSGLALLGISSKHAEVSQFAQPVESTGGKSESLASWSESSISQRESSISSSWWGGSSSVSTGVSLESEMDDVPLLASTMLDLEQKFSSEAEILEAMERADAIAAGTSSAHLADWLGIEDNSGSTHSSTEDLECLEKDKNANYNFETSTKQEKSSNMNMVPENESTSENFATKKLANLLGSQVSEELTQQVDDKIKVVANQLYALEQSNLTNYDPPKTKSYRDVLMSAPSATRSKSKEDGNNYLEKPELPSHSNIKSITLKENADRAVTFSGKFNTFMEWWRPSLHLSENKDEVQTTSSVGHKVGVKMDSFYSAQSSAYQTPSDGSLTSGTESGTDLYRTALSRLSDSGDESSTQSGYMKSSSELASSEDSETNSSSKEIAAPRVSQTTSDYDVEGGNLADVECSCEASTIRRDLVSDDGSTRARKRQRNVFKQAHNASDSCTSDNDSYSERRGARREIATVGRERARGGKGSSLSSLDDCNSAKSSDSRDRMSTSRDSSASSRSPSSSKLSSSSSSCGEQLEPAIMRLNPECPPFVPRAVRLQSQSSRPPSVSFADERELCVQEASPRKSFGDGETCSENKSLDKSLMPPPSSTKVPGGGSAYLRRMSELRLSADSGIDTTGNYNTSTNTTHGGRLQSPAVQSLDDSAFPDVHVAENIEENVFFGPSFMKQFEADTMERPVFDSNTKFGAELPCVEECITRNVESSHKSEALNVQKDPLGEDIFCNDGSSTSNVLEPPPYRCNLSHHLDFVPIENLSPNTMENPGNGHFPRFNTTPTNVNAILSLSQRVVRLRVKKPLAPPDSSNPQREHQSQEKAKAEPEYDHYGTGFVFNVNADFFEVRTHQAVVGKVEEATRAEVIFDLTIAGDRHIFEVPGS